MWWAQCGSSSTHRGDVIGCEYDDCGPSAADDEVIKRADLRLGFGFGTA
jgi:hypothetical protein